MTAYPGFTVNFPRYCSKCLKPYPDRDFTVGVEHEARARAWSRQRLITIWSVKVPICSSCYKPKLRIILKVCIAIGVLLMFGMGVFIRYALFGPPLELVLQGEGFILLIVSGVLYFTLTRPSVRMKTTPPQVTFWFKNPRYGEMFSAANRGSVSIKP